MIFWVFVNLYWTSNSHPDATHMCRHMAGMWPENRPQPKMGLNGVRNFAPTWWSGWVGVPGGYTYCTSLRAMKGTHICFQSMIVSILGHMLVCRLLGLVCETPENRQFSCNLAYNSTSVNDQKRLFSSKIQVKLL